MTLPDQSTASTTPFVGVNGHAVAADDDAPFPADAVPGRYIAEVLWPTLPPQVRRVLGQLGPYVAIDDMVALGWTGERPDAEAVDGWCCKNLTGQKLNFYAKTIARQELSALLHGINPDRTVALASLLGPADAGHPWAVAVVDWLRDANTVSTRRASLTVTAAQLLCQGASQAEVDGLPTADMRTLAVSARMVATWAEAERLERRTEAARMEASRAAAEVAIPERIDLATHVPESVTWTVDGLLTRGGVLGLYAERKAGKTKCVRELNRCALDGSPFLGRFAINLADDAEVVLFDTEMPLSTLHGQYHRAGVQNLHRLNLRALRGAERSLDARVDAVRTRWREQIAPGSLLIVDCLYSLFGALGVSENSDEVVSVLAGLRTLATECEAAGLVIVHHLGKDPDKGARGHSSIEGFPDAIARIELDGPPTADTARTFSAYGRDVSVDAGVLILGDDDRLTLGGNLNAERRAATRDADNDAVWELIDQHPGLSVRGLLDLPGVRRSLSRDRIREAVDRLETVSRIVNKGTPARPQWHALIGVDPFAGTGVQ